MRHLILSLLFVVLTACTATPSTQITAVPSSLFPTAEATSESTSCPVTMPKRVENVRDGVIFDPSYVIGSEKFWTEVSEDNIIIAERWLIQPDGSIKVKWPWLYHEQIEGDLKVVGKLVGESNASAAQYELAQDINTAEFPEMEPGIAASVSYMVFPSTGCWTVVATKGLEQIEFITQVQEAES